MTEELKSKLKYLAEKYENSSFLKSDPSQFLKWYKNQEDTEIAAFIAAMLSFGNRKLFIPKIREIFILADKSGGIYKWIKSKSFEKDFVCENGCDKTKFYRFYSYSDMKMLFSAFYTILEKSKTFGDFVKSAYEAEMQEQVSKKSAEYERLALVFANAFACCKIVPKGKTSANKRINMFLRWMVRTNSPVDLGLWKWFSSADLIIPLDTHVVQESEKLGLIPKNTSASLKTAKIITKQLKEIWPTDPCKGDFALFGLGVDEKK